MPKRIGFHVIYATSEDPAHLGSELGWAGPSSRGWRSGVGVRGPHDLVLQLEARVAVTRVQLLAHQTLIPERIEILVHDSAGSGGAPRTPSSPQYCAAGWVGLAPPMPGSAPTPAPHPQAPVPEGGPKSRELRTASLPKIPATYLRLRLSEPYKCEDNKNNQVALMGVNVFGVTLDAEGAEVPSPAETYSPYDDLAFIMYVDPEIAIIIRQLEEKKHGAILAERFEYARKLKAATLALCSGGRALGALQLHKRLAALAEQYERASRKRDAIAVGRARLAQALRITTLLEADGPDSANDEYSEEISFTMDMLSQPTSHMSFDAPSPPNLPLVALPLSSKDSTISSCQGSETLTDRVETSSTYVNTIPKHNRNSLIMDENRTINYINEMDNPKEQHVAETSNQNHNNNGNYNNDNKNYRRSNNDACSINDLSDNSRITSPQLTNQVYSGNMQLSKKKIKESSLASYNHISSSENDLIDGGKAYLEEQNSGFGSSVDVQLRNGSPQRTVGAGRLGGRDGSYFNSPANSVSPTNMQYTESLRNGEASPAPRPQTAHAPPAALPPGIVVRRRNKSAGPAPPAHHRSSYEAYEERLLPALRHSHTNEFLRGCQTEPADPPKGRPKMGERDRKQAALPILIFGEDLVEKFYSKHFSEKEEGLQNLKMSLRNFDTKPAGPGPGVGGRGVPCSLSPNKTARAATLLLHRALRDPVHSVYSLAADTTRIFFTEFIQGRVNAAEITRCVEKLVPELLTRAGDPAPRVHSLAMHTLLSMADCPPVRSLNIIPLHLVRPLTAGTAPRLALSRLLMVEQLLLNHGIDKHSGLRARCVAELGAGGLTHGQGAVRRAAERLLLAAYCKAPRLVRAQLPPDDPVTRRNLIYRHLFEGFDRVDQKKQEELMGINQSDDCLPDRSRKYQEDMTKMADSMKMSQISNMSSSQMSGSLMNSSMMSSSIMSGSQMSDSLLSSSMMNSSMMKSSLMNSSQMSSSQMSMSGSMSGSIYQPKSSMKRPTKKYGTSAVGFNGVKNDTEYPGYNKLRLDSAVSPKHQPKVNRTPQNPRNYVLEKNWQNSIMQNGNYCPQADSSTGKVPPEIQETKYQQYQTTQQQDYPRNAPKNDKRFESKMNGDSKYLMNSSMTNLANGHSTKIVARNLHSSIVFDNRTSYSDGENTATVENDIKRMQMDDDQNVSEVMNTSSRANPKGSPVGSLKRNKNTRNVIYRSKSGPNVSTCYMDDNYDSFDDSQMEVETYGYCKEDGGRSSQANSRSGSSTPKACDMRNNCVEAETCPFCLCEVENGGLDTHYWRSCPLLGRCPSCRAPLQLRDLNNHITGDCPQSNEYRLCGRCMEPVIIENFQRHVADNDCIESSEEYWKCPLCCMSVEAEEDSWRLHLMGAGGAGGCPMNPRAPRPH